ncbi:hypothetical protein ACYPKM_04510 [Pseudomonas aeruginosa]
MEKKELDRVVRQLIKVGAAGMADDCKTLEAGAQLSIHNALSALTKDEVRYVQNEIVNNFDHHASQI